MRFKHIKKDQSDIKLLKKSLAAFLNLSKSDRLFLWISPSELEKL